MSPCKSLLTETGRQVVRSLKRKTMKNLSYTGRFLRSWNYNRHKKFSSSPLSISNATASSANIIYTAHLSSFQINQIELEDGDLITAFDFLMEKESLIIGTQNGLLLLHNMDDNSTEIVGQVEGGAECISPSPDGDLLAILTGFRQVLVMTHD